MTDGRFIRGVTNDVQIKFKNAERHEKSGRLEELIESYPTKSYHRIIKHLDEINNLLEENKLFIEDHNSIKCKIKIRRKD